MDLRIWPWREIAYLKDQLALERRSSMHFQHMQTYWRGEWLSIWKALQAQQRGCMRLRRKLDRALERLKSQQGA